MTVIGCQQLPPHSIVDSLVCEAVVRLSCCQAQLLSGSAVVRLSCCQAQRWRCRCCQLSEASDSFRSDTSAGHFLKVWHSAHNWSFKQLITSLINQSINSVNSSRWETDINKHTCVNLCVCFSWIMTVILIHYLICCWLLTGCVSDVSSPPATTTVTSLWHHCDITVTWSAFLPETQETLSDKLRRNECVKYTSGFIL